MAQPYVGEIRMFAGNFAPAGWMFCEGQLLPISENETLFQLIGTTYGGDGESTFALPDLRGRIPIHQGNGVHPGRDRRRGGDHADRAADPGAHPSVPGARATPASTEPGGNRAWRATTASNIYAVRRATLDRRWRPRRSSPVGGSQPHTNFQPYLCVNFIISLFGIFPSPT